MIRLHPIILIMCLQVLKLADSKLLCTSAMSLVLGSWPPRRIGIEREPDIFETPLECYRKIYFEAIDVVVINEKSCTSIPHAR